MSTPTTLERLLARAEDDPAILAVLLFGSRARAEASDASDVDVCLVMHPEVRTGPSEIRLAYLADFDLDIHVFQALPLPIRRRVLKEGRVLLSKDEDALYDLALRTAKEFDDFRHIYEAYLEAIADGGS